MRVCKAVNEHGTLSRTCQFIAIHSDGTLGLNNTPFPISLRTVSGVNDTLPYYRNVRLNEVTFPVISGNNAVTNNHQPIRSIPYSRKNTDQVMFHTCKPA